MWSGSKKACFFKNKKAIPRILNVITSHTQHNRFEARVQGKNASKSRGVPSSNRPATYPIVVDLHRRDTSPMEEAKRKTKKTCNSFMSHPMFPITYLHPRPRIDTIYHRYPMRVPCRQRYRSEMNGHKEEVTFTSCTR